MANTTTQFTIKINGTEQLVELNDLIQTNVRSLGDLKEQQDLLQQAFEQADYGSNEFLKIRDALKDVNSEIKTVEESVEGLTFTEKLQGAAQAVGAVGSAFAFASTSVQAFGDANSQTAQDLQKLETQIQAIQQGFTTFTELTATLTEKNGLFKRSLDFIGKGFTSAGISARGFGLVTRAALAATGIGLLVVAISTLIANFDEIKKAGGELFKSWQPFFDGVRNFASALTFGLIDSAASAKIKAQSQAISDSIVKTQERTSKELDAINTKFELRQISAVQKAQSNFDALSKQVQETRKKNEGLLQNIISDKDVEEFGNKISQARLKLIRNIRPEDNKIPIITPVTKRTIESAIDDLGRVEEKYKILNKQRTELSKKKEFTDKDIETLKQIEKGFTEIEGTLRKVQAGLIWVDPIGSLFKSMSNIYIPDLINISEKFADRQNNILLTEKGINAQLAAQNALSASGLTLEDEKRKERLAELQTIQQIAAIQSQIDLERNKRSESNNNLLKQGVDLILSFGNALKSPEFRGDLPVFKNFKEQLQFISSKLTGTFKGIFDDILNSSPEAIVNVDKLTEALEKYRVEKKRTETVKANEAIQPLQAELNLNRSILKEGLEKDENVKKSLKARNILISQEIKTIRAELKATIADIETTTQQLLTSIPRTIEAAKFEEQSRQLDKVKMAFEDYKNGLQLSTEQVNLLFTELGVNAKIAFNTLTEEEKALVETDVTNRLIEQLTNLKEQAKQLAVTFPEVKDAVNTYTDSIDEATRALSTNDKASQERIKNLEFELKLLQKQTELTKNEGVAQRPAQTLKQYQLQREAITRNGQLQKEIIEDNFKVETKGLKETDIKYQIAIQKRDSLLEEVNIKTIQSLDNAREAFAKLIINSIGDISNSVGQIFDTIYQGQTEAIDRQITLNQYAIDTLTEQITAIQDQIGFVDEIINQRKAAIDELQQAAESSTGGQREEILKQLDAEVKRTKDLVKEKKALQKQEENATKSQQKLEKENQKLAAQSIVIQAKQAVTAQILGIAQTGVAIATIAASSARQDFTFGIATVASIIAVTAALTANIIGIASSLKNLKVAEANPILQDADGGFARDAKPLPKMAQGGYTPMKGYGRDTTGEDNVGNYRLHANEYVVPRWMVESAKYGSMVHEMESARKRGFAEGGSPVPLRQINVDANQEMSLLLRANLNKPVFVAVTDINDGQSRVNVIENRARF